MKQKLFLLLVACCLSMSSAWAESITQQQAANVAEGFMAKHANFSGSMKLSQKAPRLGAAASSDKASYYVFNADRQRGGFVIVAGDDRAPMVLGYSDSGVFDADNVPLALQELLDSYASQIEAMDKVSSPMLNDTPREAIAPMLTTEWGQSAPYSTRLPIISGAHAMTGAGTVAMAQIMNHFQWPERPTSTIPAYVTSSLSISMPALPVSDFEWDLMQNCYLNTDTASMNAAAVAKVMLYCAQAQALNFKANSTSTNIMIIPQVMSTYFGYQPSMRLLNRQNYSTAEWEDIIYNEIAAQRPVIYCGNKGSNSQTFVCDGCDNQGLFHVNWGLNGQYDGYYRLNVMNIDQMGTGSSSWTYGFVESQMAIVGIEPGSTNPSEFEMTSTQVTLHSYVPTRSDEDFFQATVSGRFYNLTTQVMAADFGWGLFKGDTVLVNISGAYVKSLAPGSYMNHSERLLKFGYGLTSGTYRIMQMYSRRNAYDWHPCVGADKNYIEVVIRGDSCFLTHHGNSSMTDVTVNSIATQGNMHPNRPVDITVNLTNGGESLYNMLYMRVNGSQSSRGIVSAAQGESVDVNFRYMPTAAGDYGLSFSFNEDGSNPIATDTIHVEAMPAASLSATVEMLNVTNADQNVITDDKLRMRLAVTNNGATAYDEDISVGLFKLYHDSYDTQTHAINQRVVIEPGATDTLLVELDGVVSGWQYFAKAYYYSNGRQVDLKKTGTYTVIYPGDAEVYEVNTLVTPADAGTISIDNGVVDGCAPEGQTILFSVTPQEGYEFVDVFVTSFAGDTIPVTLNDGYYRFVMPASPVTIQANFIAIHAVSLTNIITGGVASVSTEQAHAGDEVTVTAQPNVGWLLQDVTVTYGDTAVIVIDGGEDNLTFVMPDEDVTVTPHFVRSTADRFELVTNASDITADGIYMIANKPNDRAMKFHQEGERSFMGTSISKWIDDDKSILSISDETCMFIVDNLSIDTIPTDSTYKLVVSGHLNTGNGYLATQRGTIFLTKVMSRETLINIALNDTADNCLMSFVDGSLVNYNQSLDWFGTSDNMGHPEAQIWLYKLVDSHTVTVAATEGGSVTIDATEMNGMIQRGTIVTATVIPDEGNVIADVTVTTANGDVVEVIVDDENGTYSFAMPGSDVTVSVTFVVPEPPIEIGDVNGDHELSIADVTDLINYLLTGEDEGINTDAADCNHDQEVGIADVTALINYLLTGFWPATDGGEVGE